MLCERKRTIVWDGEKKMKKLALAALFSMVIATPVSAASYTVSKDDTLFKLSQRFGVSIDELKKANKLTSDVIKMGQVLNIPSTTLASRSGSGTQASTTSGYVAANPSNRSTTVLSANQAKKNVTPAPPKKEQPTKSTTVATNQVSTAKSSREGTRDFDERQMNAVINNLLGVPYKWGGTTLEGFDCSGFTSYVFNELGVTLPRTSLEQFDAGQSVSDEELKPGDLLFFDSEKKGTITHVGVYIGDNQMAHAATKNVRIDNLDWYYKNYQYYGAKRIF
ncbi:endopeptidase LytE family protein [Aneurinibacillus aneurinilyticus ATCC 12856]|uniref:Endopeptidase LytE family protein n=2 Tax=Aneurinibacillus aneurinilyticus TaxID=1391 RepID=U1Y5U9_ANEAE|nr:endopeptidase LytE family protein [Aneurinibacillus aneurinilyticus ATCC 12856]